MYTFIWETVTIQRSITVADWDPLSTASAPARSAFLFINRFARKNPPVFISLLPVAAPSTLTCPMVMRAFDMPFLGTHHGWRSLRPLGLQTARLP